MGLRFRKTISILPGVRINLGKSSASVSVGVPGFRKTFNTKGRVTTTVGLPGTGLYYVDTKYPKKEKERKEAAKRKAAQAAPERAMPEEEVRPAARPAPEVPRREISVDRPAPAGAIPRRPMQVNRESILSIHKMADDTIPWQEVRDCSEPPDPSYNAEMWAYYHSVAGDVLAGDIDAMLRVIYEVNPLDDLLDYGSGFTFGTDDPSRMEVEFTVNDEALLSMKAVSRRAEYNNILQDFVCSTAIRVARDIFALLPVETVVVHALLRNDTVLSVAFDRPAMGKIRFGFIDPSDTVARFRCNMNYSDAAGFAPVDPLE